MDYCAESLDRVAIAAIRQRDHVFECDFGVMSFMNQDFHPGEQLKILGLSSKS